MVRGRLSLRETDKARAESVEDTALTLTLSQRERGPGRGRPQLNPPRRRCPAPGRSHRAAVETVDQLPQAAVVVPAEGKNESRQVGQQRLVPLLRQRPADAELAPSQKIGEAVVDLRQQGGVGGLVQAEDEVAADARML